MACAVRGDVISVQKVVCLHGELFFPFSKRREREESVCVCNGGNQFTNRYLVEGNARKNLTMRLLLCAVSILCFALVISAKKQIEEDNIDPIGTEEKDHSSKKYSKDYQKSYHHGNHKHKKHSDLEKQVKEAEPKPKSVPVEVPESEVQLQSDLETNKKSVEKKHQRAQVEDLHLQDLTYEENLKKEKKKRKEHHGAHQAEVLEKRKHKEPKLFDEHEKHHSVEGKVIEDTFEPLQEKSAPSGEKKKNKDKKFKNGKKKAFEKNKDKGKKSKDGKKNKNKDKKNKDKKKW